MANNPQSSNTSNGNLLMQGQSDDQTLLYKDDASKIPAQHIKISKQNILQSKPVSAVNSGNGGSIGNQNSQNNSQNQHSSSNDDNSQNGQVNNPQLQAQLDAMGLGQMKLGKSSSSKIIQIINNYNVNINNNYNPENGGQQNGNGAPTNIVIEGVKNMNEQQLQEHLLQELQKLQKPTNVQQHGSQQASSSKAVGKNAHGGSSHKPRRIQTQQSSENFNPYEENNKVVIVDSVQKIPNQQHPQSGKSNASKGNYDNNRSTFNNINIQQIHSVNSSGGKQSMNPPSIRGQQNQNSQYSNFRRKISNSHKQSLTQLHDQQRAATHQQNQQMHNSREHINEDPSYRNNTNGSNTTINNHQQSDQKQPTSQTVTQNSQNIPGSRHNIGLPINQQIKTGKFVLLTNNSQASNAINNRQNLPQYYAPQGHVDSVQNNYQNSSLGGKTNNKFIQKQQIANNSNSLGREQLKSAGVIGFVNQTSDQNRAVSNVNHGALHQMTTDGSIGQHGVQRNQNGKKNINMNNNQNYGSFEEENPYQPYQNQNMKGVGSNSSTINSRIVNQLQSSLNSGLGSLAGGNPNGSSRIRDLSGNSGHNQPVIIGKNNSALPQKNMGKMNNKIKDFSASSNGGGSNNPDPHGRRLSPDQNRILSKKQLKQQQNMSPPRINIIKQKNYNNVNLNKLNAGGHQNSGHQGNNNMQFVNHSQNFQNSNNNNFGGGLAHSSNIGSSNLQNRIGGVDTRNPVLNDEYDEDDNAVYEQDEFEPIDDNQGTGLRGATNVQNNTFYAGQNTKFFDKRILASQKQNRPKNNFGGVQGVNVDPGDQNSSGGGGYSPHIKQQKKQMGKKMQQVLGGNLQGQRGTAGGGQGLPNVNESFKNQGSNQQSGLPSLSRTGNYFHPNTNNNNRRGAENLGGPNGQRVASRRTSTRQKADMQGARIIHSRQRQDQFLAADHPQNVYTINMGQSVKMSPDQSHSKIPFSNYHQNQQRTGNTAVAPPKQLGSLTQNINNKANSFKIKQLPVDFNNGKEMESEAREHLNLAQYNFNKMAVIDEEGIESAVNKRGTRGNDHLMSAGQDRRATMGMHNTTSNFYPTKFGDRLPTRGDVQSRGNVRDVQSRGRQQLVPSAQGTRRGNSRAEGSLGRVQQKQINQAQQMAKGGTQYGNMFQQDQNHISLMGPNSGDRNHGGNSLGIMHQNSTQNSIGNYENSSNPRGNNIPTAVSNIQKSIPLKLQNKSRIRHEIRISTESMQNAQNLANMNQPYQQSSNGARRNSQAADEVGSNGEHARRQKQQMSGMNLENLDEFDQFSNGNVGANSLYDHGFDPPTKMDSGRGTNSLPGGFNRNDVSLPQNHMFDIEEDAEDQHYQ